MPFDFSKCIFIDDKPKDIISIYNKKPLGIYRIKHLGQKYSSEKLDLPITEVNNLEEILDKLEKLKLK